MGSDEARIGTNHYTFVDAFSMAADGDTVYLLKDITLNPTLLINGNKMPTPKMMILIL